MELGRGEEVSLLYAESKKKWYKWTYLQNRNTLTDLENKLIMVAGTGERIKERDC